MANESLAQPLTGAAQTGRERRLLIFVGAAIILVAAVAIGFLARYLNLQGGGAGHGAHNPGDNGVTAPVDRVIAIEASDAMRFSPDSLTVTAGETVQFE